MISFIGSDVVSRLVRYFLMMKMMMGGPPFM